MKTLKPCGTHAAYERHLYHGEEPCDACLEANRVYHQAWRDRTRNKYGVTQPWRARPELMHGRSDA